MDRGMTPDSEIVEAMHEAWEDTVSTYKVQKFGQLFAVMLDPMSMPPSTMALAGDFSITTHETEAAARFDLRDRAIRAALAAATPLIKARMLGEMLQFYSRKVYARGFGEGLKEYAKSKNITIPGMED